MAKVLQDPDAGNMAVSTVNTTVCVVHNQHIGLLYRGD